MRIAIQSLCLTLVIGISFSQVTWGWTSKQEIEKANQIRQKYRSLGTLQALTNNNKAVLIHRMRSDYSTWFDQQAKNSFSLAKNEILPSTSYGVTVVEPGTYYLGYVRYDHHKTAHVRYSSSAQGRDKPQVTVTNTTFDEPYTVNVWHNQVSHYEQQQTGTECFMVSDGRGGSECMDQPVYSNVEVIDRAAGYYPETRYRPEPGLSAELRFNTQQTPAVLTVQPGEMVLIDDIGFEGFDWNVNACSPATASSWSCAVNQYQLWRYINQSNYNDLRGQLLKVGWSPEVISRIQYRPFNFMAVKKAKSLADRELYTNP